MGQEKMRWSKSELKELTETIVSELKEGPFDISDWDVFAEYVEHNLKTSQQDDFLSEVVVNAFKSYQRYETDMAVSNLIDKGLVRMLVNQDGKLVYEATEKGRDLGTLIIKMKNGKIK